MLNRNKIIEEARTWLGTPWRHQGRTRKGVDCVGLIVQVANSLGLNPSGYDFCGYSRHAGGLELLSHFRNNMTEKLISAALPGDVIVFRDNAYPCHVAFASERYGVIYMIHAYAIRRQVFEETFSDEWRSKAIYCYEFPEISVER